MQQTTSRRRPSPRGPAATPTSSRRPAAPRPAAPPKRKRRRDPLWARLMVFLGALLMMASGGAIVGSKVLLTQYSDSIQQENLLGGAAEQRTSIEGPINILLVGIDQRPNSDELIRADSIIILHVNAAHDQAFLISVPRDLSANIQPNKKTGYIGGVDKINAAFAFGSQNGGGREGGFELLALTLKKMTGVEFNGGMIVDFGGFQSLVKALGGVDMCIDQKVVSEHVGTDSKGRFRSPYDGGKPAVYEAGCHRLEPWQALDLVRQRKSLANGDYDRAKNQQRFIKAMVKEAKKQGVATNPVKLLQMSKAAGDAVTIDRRGVSIEDWVFTLRNVIDSDVVMLKTNGGVSNAGQGGSNEELTQESRLMFQALRDDKLDEFVAAYPQFVNADGGPV